MKRVSHLFEKIISDENLAKAIDTVNKTHRWNHYPDKPNKTTLWVEITKEERIKELRMMIENGFIPSPTVKKTRYDNNARKWREIYEPKLYPDQYIHHALVQVIEPVMMRGMDKWCCGSIKGRGAHYGIRQIKKWMKDKSSTRYCLEADIRHFYDSLTPSMVMKRIKQLIKDYRALDLIERIIHNGIQIGAYCSQWFANTFLQPLDHYLREHFKVKHYIRYMDNFTIFSNRKRTLRKVREFMSEWFTVHELELKSNWQIFNCDKRLPNALGYRFGRGYILLRKHALLNFKRQLKTFYYLRERGRKIPLRLAQGLLSRFGMLRHCNSVSLYKRLVKKHTQRHLKDVVRYFQKGVTVTWNTYLENQKCMANV